MGVVVGMVAADAILEGKIACTREHSGSQYDGFADKVRVLQRACSLVRYNRGYEVE